MNKKTRWSITGVAIALLTACVYRIDFQQGNHLSAQDVAEVKTGMSKQQVRQVLGTPMITDPYHHNRWDYLWYERTGKANDDIQVSRLEVHFDNDVVSRTVVDGIEQMQAGAISNE